MIGRAPHSPAANVCMQSAVPRTNRSPAQRASIRQGRAALPTATSIRAHLPFLPVGRTELQSTHARRRATSCGHRAHHPDPLPGRGTDGRVPTATSIRAPLVSCRRDEPNYSRCMRAAAQINPAPVELTVLMPCLDEAGTVGICVRKALAACGAAGIEAEVLVADNGSRDGSPLIARDAGARIIHVEEKGYGSALKAGIEAARGRYVVMGDADDSYAFEDVPRFLERLRQGDDLVMGSRFRGVIHQGAMPFLHRVLGNPVLTFILNVFFGAGITDAYCGLRGFSRDSIRKLSLHSPGMEFAIEMIVRAA